MKKSHALLILLLAVLAGCRSPAQVSRTMPEAAQEDDIREAVLRYQIGSPTSPSHTDAGAIEPSATLPPGAQWHRMYFLSLGNNTDPSDALMQRFLGSTIPVKKVSQSYRDEKGGGWDCCQVKDRSSNTLGLIYYVSDIQWLDDDTVSAKSGYYGGGLYARQNTYTLVRDVAAWKVKDIEYGPVS